MGSSLDRRDDYRRSHRKRRYSSSSSAASSRSRSRSRDNRSKRKSRRRDHYRSRHRSRSYSRSPSYHRRTRYYGTRENPYKSRVIGIFGLSSATNEARLMEIFTPFGPMEHVSIIHDAKTGNSRGFGFIYFTQIESATRARNECNGMTIEGKRIRVDYSITKRAHTPTPGVYMGQPKTSERCHRSDRRHRRSHRDCSDHESSRYSRSRSR